MVRSVACLRGPPRPAVILVLRALACALWLVAGRGRRSSGPLWRTYAHDDLSRAVDPVRRPVRWSVLSQLRRVGPLRWPVLALPEKFF